MRKLLSILIVFMAAIALLYVSRFWPFELWGRQSWLTEIGLRPQGGLLMQWLRGTEFAQFELIIWASASFLVLSVTEFVVSKLR